METKFEILVNLYHKANSICDPIEFSNRQKDLLKYLAGFIIERYTPPETEQEENKEPDKDTGKES